MTKRKIAVLGGGIAGLTAAYELTKTPELRAKHDVTVYQLGWRLGGKLASGREGPEVRNVEHGLHVWFGFYDNAFNLLYDVLEHWQHDPRSRVQEWTDVLKPRNYTPIGYQETNGTWTYFPQLWVQTGPNKPGGQKVDWDLWDIVSGLLDAIEIWLFHPEEGVARERLAFEVPDHIASLVERALEVFDDDDERPPPSSEGMLGRLYHDTARRWLKSIQRDVASFTVPHFDGLRWLLRKISDEVDEEIEGATGSKRLYWMFADYALSMLCGLINPAYGILEDGDLNRINHLEFATWMKENGCSPRVLESTFMRVLYEAIFQYTEGDRRKPDMEAGTAVRLILRLIFTYKGAVLYEVQGGMGDLVIAPLYEVMKQRGVKFELFHKVERLELSADKRNVARVHFAVQAKTIDGEPYRPTFQVDYSPAWPAEPLWDQLENGAAMKATGVDFESKWGPSAPSTPRVIVRGEQFDDVVLAVALGAFKKLNDEPTMVDELTAASPRWATMCEKLGLVPSQAVQVWMDYDIEQLGFDYKRKDMQGQLPALVNGPDPLDIWADMTQVLGVEQWRGNPPRSVHYFCGVYPTQLYKEPSTSAGTFQRAQAEIKTQAIRWFSDFTGYLWPRAAVPGSWQMDWDKLHDDRGRNGVARFDAQFWRANVEPTECCVQSMTDTCRYRLAPGGSGFDNLYLAGEWTRTGVNASCVEGAIMSGMGAAKALAGLPIHIVGWDWLQKW